MENNSHGNTNATPGMAGNGEGAISKTSSRVHAAVDSVAAAADETARKAKPAIERVAAMAHHAVDTAAGAAAPTAEWLSQQRETLTTKPKALVADTCGYVSANPLKSVGIAAVIGFLLSRIMR
jgi:ElaB/YqjD/DUF883 family membrane-anchored ribosome-binding protein